MSVQRILNQGTSSQAQRRGSAAVVALVAVTVLVGLCGAMLMIASRSNSEGGAAVDRHQASAAAQAGIDEALVRIAAGNVDDIGAADMPQAFGGGTYWVDVTPDEDAGICTVAAYAEVRGENEAMEALLSSGGLDIYDHALFAGNSGDDPLYTLKLGGSGAQADQVVGDVYSGGSVAVTGTASVDGTIRAQDDVSGASGESGVYQPTPDLAAMDYPSTADFKVQELFLTATYKSNALGGKAYQVPEANAAHIFRKNPSDRASDINATAKNDYFLEDPYEPVQSDSGSTGTNACPITLSGRLGRARLERQPQGLLHRRQPLDPQQERLLVQDQSQRAERRPGDLRDQGQHLLLRQRVLQEHAGGRDRLHRHEGLRRGGQRQHLLR